MMEFSGEFTVDGTPDELWKYFTDPDILSDCAPGCESMTMASPSTLTASLAVGVGSVKPSFDVDAVVTECDRPRRLEIKGSGEASRNSFEVVAWQELHDNGDGTTTVTWAADAEVSGIIASMGERALGSVADTLVDDFFQQLEDHVINGTPADSKLEAASADEIEGTADPSVPDTDAGVAGEALGTVAAVADDGGPDIDAGSFLAGVGLGVLGGSLVRRLRGGGQEQPAPRPPTPVTEGDRSQEQTQVHPQVQTQPRRPVSQGNGGRNSLLILALSAALGAIGVLVWSRMRTDEDSSDEVTRTDETSMEPANSSDDVTNDVRENGEATTESTDEYSPDPESDDPLDRLESRP